MKVTDEDRIPVIIGVGQINDRPSSGAEGLDSLGLMCAAARAADIDAGGDVLGRVDWVGIVSQISFPEYQGKLDTAVSQTLGLSARHIEQSEIPSGDSPVLFINRAANAIGRGEARVALILGGEALRTASRRAAERAAKEGAAAPSGGVIGQRSARAQPNLRRRYGLVTPTDVYPLYENATRAAYGQTLAEGQAESAEIWSRFSQVAAANDAAWIRAAKTAADIIQPSADNRPIAFPYNKLMVANSSVNQGAALIVTSLAFAREIGVPENRLVYVGRGAAAHEDDDPLARADYTQSASMRVSLTQTLALNGLTVDALDHVELYSCFPCVPKMARRELGLPVEKSASVFGGLTFGGGPIGNYMTHAAASMVLALRASGTNGLLFANGGYATHNHSIVLTRTPQPAGVFPQDYDFQAIADAARDAPPPLDEMYQGPATLETYTVIYDREGSPRFGVVLGRTPDGQRVIGRVPAQDTAAIAFLTSGQAEPVGTGGRIRREGELNVWEPKW